MKTKLGLSKEVLRLRYAVYVDEFGWLEGDDRLKTEMDIFDAVSVNIGVHDNDKDVGCVRVVKRKPILPLEIVREKIFESAVDILDTKRCCEISRLAIHKDYRNNGDICMQLLLSAVAVADILTNEFVFTVMESRLGKAVIRKGFRLSLASMGVNFHGKRIVYIGKVADIYNLPESALRKYEYIKSGLSL